MSDLDGGEEGVKLTKMTIKTITTKVMAAITTKTTTKIAATTMALTRRA